MAIVNLYLQMHQPYRLRHYGAFENHDHYFDHDLNEEITRRVVLRSYRPVTRLLLDATLRHAGAFRFSLSITGTLVEQLNAIAPDVLDTLRRLAETGCVEFLAETYHHNLSGLQSPEFFAQELSRHSAMIDKNFGQTPVVVRNTELLYNDQVAQHIDTSGRYRGVLTEGADTILAGRPAGRVYVSPCGLPVLLKHHVFSDDIAFRFGNPNTRPTAAGYAARVTRSAALPLAQENDPTDQEHPAILRNLFMDFETFGEHHAAETGIFDFLAELPGEILQLQHRFLTPREILDEFDPVDFFACPQTISWADEARDASAWLGNDLQKSA
ncbi:MAG: glycoside hydrolase family 57 protein, partial [Algisphaera sp.]